MLVQLGETDRVITEYQPVTEDGDRLGIILTVSFDTVHEIYALTTLQPNGDREIMWRGNFRTVWVRFGDEVDSFEEDNLRNQNREEDIQKILG